MTTRNIAHRGASADAPENTLPAFVLAHQQGAQMIEFDVRPTRDGQIVVFHDDTTERWNGRPDAIASMSLHEARQVDLCGATMPTLDEVCAWAATTGLMLNIEIKVTGIEAAVAQIVQTHGVGERVVVSAFDFSVLETMRTVVPELALGVLMASDALGTDAPFGEDWPLPLLEQYGARAWHPSHRLPHLDQLIPRVRQAGFAVNVWTVDDPAVMQRFLDLHVDGIMTNRPALLQRVMDSWNTTPRSHT